MKLKRKEKISIALLVVACLAVAGYFVYQEVSTTLKEQQQQEYHDQNSWYYGVGETATFDSAQDEATGEKQNRAVFGWNGTMEVTVVSAELYGDPEQAGLSSEQFFDWRDGGQLVLVTLHLKNIDATPTNEFSSGLLAFHADVFNVDEGSIVYNSEAPENMKDGMAFSVDPGQDLDLTIGYMVGLVEPTGIPDSLNVGITRNWKYGMALNVVDMTDAA